MICRRGIVVGFALWRCWSPDGSDGCRRPVWSVREEEAGGARNEGEGEVRRMLSDSGWVAGLCLRSRERWAFGSGPMDGCGVLTIISRCRLRVCEVEADLGRR